MKRNITNLSFSQSNSGPHNQKGMTIVELLIGLTIITVVFLAMAGAQMSSFTSLGKSVELKDAKTFAARILEDKYQDLISTIINASDPEAQFNIYLGCNTKTDFDSISGDYANGCDGYTEYQDYEVRWRLYSEQDNGDVPVHLEGVILLEIKVDWEEDETDYSFSLGNYLSCVYIVNHDNTTICPVARDPEVS